jgi:hypothetical protein
MRQRQYLVDTSSVVAMRGEIASWPMVPFIDDSMAGKFSPGSGADDPDEGFYYTPNSSNDKT